MKSFEKKLFIVIGCDTDPDRQGFIENVTGDKLTWRGMTEGIPETKSAVSSIADSIGKAPVFTWLMRADEQIKILCDDYNGVIEENMKQVRELEDSGDEIGWHPHFFRYDEKHKIWYQELQDIDWQCEVLESAYSSFNKSLPGKPASVRTGWIYHNNNTMKKLDKLGIRIDFSAAPGLKTNPPKNKRFPYNIYDWSITEKAPYYPSVNDYRRAARKGEASLSILEAPNFTSHSWFWGMVAGVQMARKMRDPAQLIQAIRRPTYWVNLTASPRLYTTIIDSLGKELKKSDVSKLFFITYFHPDELIANKSKIYSRENLKQNLKSILELSSRLGIPQEFIRARDIPALIRD